MENLKLNETPVRTAKNFKINNIKLENITEVYESEEKDYSSIDCISCRNMSIECIYI